MNKIYKMLVVIALLMITTGMASASGISTITIGGETQGAKGETKNITVDVSGMSGVGALQLDVTYDKNVMAANSVSFGAIAGGVPAFNINTTTGKVTLGALSTGGLSGTGNLATISFTVAGNAGESTPIQIGLTKLKDIINQDVTSQPTISGSTFTMLGVQPTATATPTEAPTATVTVTAAVTTTLTATPTVTVTEGPTTTLTVPPTATATSTPIVTPPPPVPELSPLVLISAGIIGLFLIVRRYKR